MRTVAEEETASIAAEVSATVSHRTALAAQHRHQQWQLQSMRRMIGALCARAAVRSACGAVVCVVSSVGESRVLVSEWSRGGLRCPPLCSVWTIRARCTLHTRMQKGKRQAGVGAVVCGAFSCVCGWRSDSGCAAFSVALVLPGWSAASDWSAFEFTGATRWRDRTSHCLVDRAMSAQLPLQAPFAPAAGAAFHAAAASSHSHHHSAGAAAAASSSHAAIERPQVYCGGRQGAKPYQEDSFFSWCSPAARVIVGGVFGTQRTFHRRIKLQEM